MNERTRRLFSQFFYEDPAQYLMKTVPEKILSQQDLDDLLGLKNDKSLNLHPEEKKNQD